VFSKVLIANRGEIAVRIIRGCSELGIATVAVYSDLDRQALHVRLADEAYNLGGKTSAESYLNTATILDIVKRSGADALHPGYGFFSENADFARAITALGVVFIGPNPEAIEVMGDKISARHAAEKVGVCGVPGTTETIADPTQIIDFGNANGWPVAVKAAYGGGGRGMKVVYHAEQAAEQLSAAQREALAYFGRDECYMERYLKNPRHVEVQILADMHGNCVHLGTRDCSVQRRHQKLIEEAPAPNIDPAIITAMGEAAVQVAQGCNYVNAGTVEFLYEDGEFYYLEMNTRLQVEHPATEMITGLDLVEQQIRVASGEPLAFSQQDVAAIGHAIEIRINAEDPSGGAFLPSPGKITALTAAAGFGTRIDSGYQSGDTVSEYYDNLLAKLIVWGKDRPRAIARALRALRETNIEGVATTIPATIAVLEHGDFAAIKHSTKWLEESVDLSALPTTLSSVEAQDSDEPLVKRKVDVEVNGKHFSVSMWVPESPLGSSATAKAPTRTARPRSEVSRSGPNNGEVTVPMQGTIVKVLVNVGDNVEVGDAIVVLEAMKMENNVTAERAGTVKEVRVAAGDSVGAGDIVSVID